jgi:enamine deaminase RidA (YjgF/YER057c/UK114 family)
MSVIRKASGGPWEEPFGYSRVVVAGPTAYVSGCTAAIDNGVDHEADPYLQALTSFDNALTALGSVGFEARHVVRTRMYIVHPRDADEVGRAHKERFDAVRPAATMVVVAKLIDPRMLVEVELEAYRDGTEAAP